MPRQSKIPPLTDEQVDALHEFARQHGHQWKSALRRHWMRASIGIPELQQVRNTHGPSWLSTFRPSMEPARYVAILVHVPIGRFPVIDKSRYTFTRAKAIAALAELVAASDPVLRPTGFIIELKHPWAG